MNALIKGSGILSIAANKLGAKIVKGIDIDYQAINKANLNNKLNKTEIPFIVSDNYIPKKKYQIVVANILQSILIYLAPKLSEAANEKLVLSGILKKQVPEISEIFNPWIKLEIKDEMDGWILLEGSIK